MTLSLVFFILIIVLGVVGNIKAAQVKAFGAWNIWFWNIVWLLALKATWIPFQ